MPSSSPPGAPILVVDDDPTVEALAVLAETSPRLIVSDIVMPRMSGVELAATVRRNWPGIPLLMISGNRRPSNPSVPYLSKPFPPDALLARVAELLS